MATVDRIRRIVARDGASLFPLCPPFGAASPGVLSAGVPCPVFPPGIILF